MRSLVPGVIKKGLRLFSWQPVTPWILFVCLFVLFTDLCRVPKIKSDILRWGQCFWKEDFFFPGGLSLEVIYQSSGNSFRAFFVKTTKESYQPFWNHSIGFWPPLNLKRKILWYLYDASLITAPALHDLDDPQNSGLTTWGHGWFEGSSLDDADLAACWLKNCTSTMPDGELQKRVCPRWQLTGLKHTDTSVPHYDSTSQHGSQSYQQPIKCSSFMSATQTGDAARWNRVQVEFNYN